MAYAALWLDIQPADAVMLLTTTLLRERGLADLGPIAFDELEKLTKRKDWGDPTDAPPKALLAAAKAAVKRTKARM